MRPSFLVSRCTNSPGTARSYRRDVGGSSSTCNRAQPQRPTIRATVARLTPTAVAISPHVRRCRRSTSIRKTTAGAVACGLRCGRELRSVSGCPVRARLTLFRTVFSATRASRPTRRADRPTSRTWRNFCSTPRRQPGILVDVHPGILLIDLACLATTTFDETPRMDNPPADDLVRLHS